jgi:hypothetical protein
MAAARALASVLEAAVGNNSDELMTTILAALWSGHFV